jgi:phage tail sheath gpL-like
MSFPPASWPIPSSERDFKPAQGGSTANGTSRNVVIIANMLAAGTESVETLGSPVKSQADCNTRYGSRSEAAWMHRALRIIDPNVLVTIVAMAQAGGATASTRTWTLATNASVGCDLYIDSCAVNVPGKSRMGITVAAGDSPSTQVSNLVDTINADPDLPFSAMSGSAATNGSETSSANAFPVALVNGDTLVGKVDEAGAQTLTISAAAATVTGSGATYAAVTASHTLTLSFMGTQTVVTFSGSEATQAAFHAKINSALPGGLTGGVALNNGGQTQLTSNQLGSAAVGAVVAGSADVLTSLGLSVGALTNGTGNVPNVAQVTASQMAGLLTSTFTGGTAGSTGTANANNSVTWATNTAGATAKGVQFTSGSVVAKVAGWDTSEHNGAASGGASTITLTTYQLGARSNYWLDQVRLSYDNPTNATTISAGSTVNGAGADSCANAITAVSAREFTYHAIACTATSGGNASDGGVGQYSAYISQSLTPTVGKSQFGICGVDGTSTQSASVAQASVVNSTFFKVIPATANDWPPSMRAAAYTGILSKEQSVYAAVNLTGYTTDSNLGTVCPFPTPYLLSNVWSQTDEVTLLNGGCCDVTYDGSGAAFIRRDIASYSWLPPGSPTTTEDYRAREGHIGSVMIEWWAAFAAICKARGLNKGNIQANPASGVKPIPGQVYPFMVDSAANLLITQMCGQYQNGKPLLDPTYLKDMKAATDTTILQQGGWSLGVALRVARHNNWQQTLINETSDPS